MDYDKLLAKRAVDMKPSGIRRFFDLVSEIPDCISLGVGEPDFKTPWDIRDSAIHALELGKTQYTTNPGLLELRQELHKYLLRKYNLDYDVEQMIVTVGASEGIDMFFRTVVEPGDEIIIPDPGYVTYAPTAAFSGAKVVTVQAKEENDFRLKAEDIKAAITDKTKAILLSYPNNPTGAVLSHEDMVAIADVLRDTNILVISDEIYAELVYGDHQFESFASLPGMKERTIVLNGFSKAFSMTGWRLGYVLGPSRLIEVMLKVHQNCVMAAPTISQYAAITALRDCDDDVEEMRRQYDLRRQYCVRKLNEMGLNTFEPKGAFYVFPNISSLGMSSDEFCEKLLTEQKVAIIPGTAFGESGEGFARISYAYSIEHLREAMKRIAQFIEDHKGE